MQYGLRKVHWITQKGTVPPNTISIPNYYIKILNKIYVSLKNDSHCSNYLGSCKYRDNLHFIRKTN